MTRAGLFIEGVRVMYRACRTDYPCEGCEQGRIESVRNAVWWSWKTTYRRDVA